MRYSQKACSTTPVQTATWNPSPTRPPSASAATATLTWSRILGSGIRPTVPLAVKTYGKGFRTPPLSSPSRKVHAIAATQRFAIQGRARHNVVRNIGNMDPDAPAAIHVLDMHG